VTHPVHGIFDGPFLLLSSGVRFLAGELVENVFVLLPELQSIAITHLAGRRVVEVAVLLVRHISGDFNQF